MVRFKLLRDVEVMGVTHKAGKEFDGEELDNHFWIPVGKGVDFPVEKDVDAIAVWRTPEELCIEDLEAEFAKQKDELKISQDLNIFQAGEITRLNDRLEGLSITEIGEEFAKVQGMHSLKSKHLDAIVDLREVVEAKFAAMDKLINSPHTKDFLESVKLEAAHQRLRWKDTHDRGKEPQDWYWLLSHLSGKAVKAAFENHKEKALHHTISSAAMLLNWHGYLSGTFDDFRPGIDPDERPEAKALEVNVD